MNHLNKNYNEITREMFTFLQRQKKVVFMDNAAITLIPKYVIKNLHKYDYKPLTAYRSFHGHTYEQLLEQLRISCLSLFEIPNHCAFFAANSSDVVNKISISLRNDKFTNKKNILLSIRNHHSNIVPWIYLAKELNLEILWFNDTSELRNLYDKNTYIVALPHVSNVDGSVYKINEITDICNDKDSILVVDATQSCFFEEDMSKIDFVFFSSQKYFAHSGVGVGMLSSKLQDRLQISFGGGGSINKISYDNKVMHKDFPYSLEYGTYNSLSLISLYFALLFRKNHLDDDLCRNHLTELKNYFLYKYDAIEKNRDFDLISFSKTEKPIFSLVFDNANAHDISDMLTKKNIFNRAGTHCASKYFEEMNISSSVRLSLNIYNSISEIDRVFNVIGKIILQYKKYDNK